MINTTGRDTDTKCPKCKAQDNDLHFRKGTSACLYVCLACSHEWLVSYKKTNTTGKGTRNEKLCVDELKEDGFVDICCARRTKYNKIDFFGLFDVIAIDPDGMFIDWIQVKSNKCDKKDRDAIRNFKMPYGCRKWLWILVDRKGWKKERL